MRMRIDVRNDTRARVRASYLIAFQPQVGIFFVCRACGNFERGNQLSNFKQMTNCNTNPRGDREEKVTK